MSLEEMPASQGSLYGLFTCLSTKTIFENVLQSLPEEFSVCVCEFVEALKIGL